MLLLASACLACSCRPALARAPAALCCCLPLAPACHYLGADGSTVWPAGSIQQWTTSWAASWAARPCLGRVRVRPAGPSGFCFFIFKKKLKFQKYMSILKNFKNIPRSPSHRATGPKCNFFSSNLQRSPWRKKKDPVAPPTGDRGLLPTPGATGACRPRGGDRVPSPFISPGRHSLCHLSLKIQEKREG